MTTLYKVYFGTVVYVLFVTNNAWKVNCFIVIFCDSFPLRSVFT